MPATKPTRSTSPSTHHQSHPSIPTPLKHLGFGLLLCAWAWFSTYISQYIIAYPLYWILGEKVTLPLWTTVYNAAVYLLALTLTIFVPAFLYGLHQNRGKKSPKNSPEHTSKNSTQKSSRVGHNKLTAKLPDNPLKTTREELGLKGFPTFTDIGLAPIAFVAFAYLSTFVDNIFKTFPWYDPNQTQNVGYSGLAPGLDRIVAFLALVVIAPIAEEILFRGWLYGKLRSRLSLIPAIILVSALFGFMHGQWNVAINVGIMSIFLCLQREVTGTIYSGILLHMIKNGVAFYYIYIIRGL